MTVVEVYSVSGEIQGIFTSQWTQSKDFLIYCKVLWGKDTQRIFSDSLTLKLVGLYLSSATNFFSMNFNAIFKKEKIIKIGLLEAKLWKKTENEFKSLVYYDW